jgi:hypothetical protein
MELLDLSGPLLLEALAALLFQLLLTMYFLPIYLLELVKFLLEILALNLLTLQDLLEFCLAM